MDFQLHTFLMLIYVLCGSMSAVQGKQVLTFFRNKNWIFFQECGTSVRRSRQPRGGSLGRIIHGKLSVRGAWPWQVITLPKFIITI